MSGHRAERTGQQRTDLSAATVRNLERASGELAAKSVAAMEEQLPWFSRMPADQRASVLLITQTGVAGFIDWLRDPEGALKLTTEAFREAPRELSRWINLRHTVHLIRIATEVFEEQLPEFAADETERTVLTEGILRYGREIAFTAATTYAAAAESRGAWDARLEALVVDGIVRGDAEESLLSRASALGWDPDAAATVIVGHAPSEDPPTVVSAVRGKASRLERPVLLGVQGSRLVVILGGATEGTVAERQGNERRDTREARDIRDAGEALPRIAEAFGDGAVVAGPTVPSLTEAYISATEALSGLRAVAGWPSAPRPVRAGDLLPERALAGDAEAERQLVETIVDPLEGSGTGLVETLTTYLEVGGVLEMCARTLYVHPNTVRYRLKRVAELTGRDASNSRDALVLRIALIVGRLARARGLM
ncbi:helix-turn-helix domain-containing protein [Haloechinothrix sp. LS1_15]|uniref:PucR family transcriptional regulator n=1 Tax=Haloechinothrix sp. LS1_15 TaxID=2652248 RepID=UPI002945B3A2|nr:helix-turn-helix domain-containing protein [Haloechinothrix sp. LS1_15]MDV6012752.1 PucR family transcriptional regulator [Haloechinothrix sp. LS1_15]